MSQNRYSWDERFRYWLDSFMSKGGTSVFLSLLFLFFVAFVVMGTVRFVVFLIFPDETIEDGTFLLWHAFFQIIDSGSLAELDAGSNFPGKLVAIVTIFIGLVLFSSMVAFITQEFENRISTLKKGKSQVLEENHLLIVGFSERVIEIVKELIVANESDSGVVVIVAEMDKEAMDDYLRDSIQDFKTTKIITRSGSTTSINNLKGVGIKHAHSVVVLNNAKSSDSNEAKELADARVIKTIMAVVAARGEEAPPVIAEIYIERYRLLAETIVQGKVTTMNEADILARMLVQTSRNKGLAMVYADLVGFEGNEFYFFKPDEGWNGVNFGELQFHFMESVPLGLKLPTGEILLNPPREYILKEEDEIVVLAEDDSTINFSSEKVFEPKVHPYSNQRKVISEEHHLIVGWNNKAPIVLSEYAGYMAPGSSVDLLIEANADPEIRKDFGNIASQFPDVQMNFNKIDFQSEEELDNLGLPGYTTVSILAGSGDESEEIDARTIMRLLQIRNIFKEAENSSGVPTETKLISEIVNSENTELIVQVGVKDFLISNQFVSRIFAQVALKRRNACI
ncbi:MAG: hypothetical protein HOA75_06445 [Deltaproteobacteria bacterium]|nr:hypothetical protein [Deltaproteobacteria bacterium]